MFAIVIDKQGFKVEFVALNEDKTPQFYDLKDGESIIEEDWQVANSMNKPQWNGKEWIDADPLPPVEPEPQEPSKTDILCQKVEVLEEENTKQNTDITANTDMIFVALDATTELNESNITNTEMVLISMDALTEINEQIIALQEQINILKGVK